MSALPEVTILCASSAMDDEEVMRMHPDMYPDVVR